jgi:hypothetical protein
MQRMPGHPRCKPAVCFTVRVDLWTAWSIDDVVGVHADVVILSAVVCWARTSSNVRCQLAATVHKVSMCFPSTSGRPAPLSGDVDYWLLSIAAACAQAGRCLLVLFKVVKRSIIYSFFVARMTLS